MTTARDAYLPRKPSWLAEFGLENLLICPAARIVFQGVFRVPGVQPRRDGHCSAYPVVAAVEKHIRDMRIAILGRRDLMTCMSTGYGK